jgi:hypothetical protein
LQVLARPEEKVLDQTISMSLPERWDEAASEVGRSLLTGRRVFEDSAAHA